MKQKWWLVWDIVLLAVASIALILSMISVVLGSGWL